MTCCLSWSLFRADILHLFFFLWKYLRDKVYVIKPKEIDQLKISIFKTVVAEIRPDIMLRVIENFRGKDCKIILQIKVII